MYNGVVFNDGDVLDGSDKLKTMIDNDQYMKAIVDGIPRGYLTYSDSFYGGVNVTSNVAEATLASIDIFLPEARTIMGIIQVESCEFIDATGTNNLIVRAYEEATLRNEFWGRVQSSTGAGDVVYEPRMVSTFILNDLPVGNTNISIKGILATASPTGFTVYGEVYLYDIGKQIAES